MGSEMVLDIKAEFEEPVAEFDKINNWINSQEF
jgi:hypothetical protein